MNSPFQGHHFHFRRKREILEKLYYDTICTSEVVQHYLRNCRMTQNVVGGNSHAIYCNVYHASGLIFQ
jgi:hypothetical protein